MPSHYRPPKKILENYASVLVDFALGGGKGIKKGDVVWLVANECSRSLYAEVRKAILKAGGHIISDYRPDNDDPANPDAQNFDRDFYINAEEHQLAFFADKFYRGLIDQADHVIFIIGQTNKKALEGIDPVKIMKRQSALKPYMEWRNEKENRGKFTWTIGLYGTAAMAREAGLSEKEYWDQIIRACFLDKKDPIAEWRKVYRQLEAYRRRLNKLCDSSADDYIERFHVEGPDADLWISLGKKRRWMGGSGRNIPSFELFTSPDWRGTEGWIRFNQPLYSYGNLIDGVRLEFKNGRVAKASARKNEKVLKQMIATKNADKIGEFSMTDRRFSRITKFMAETLFDENVGGANGNTHIALGASYHDCFTGDPAKQSKKFGKAGWERLGFNDSSVHTDIVSTTPRTVTAYFKSGKTKVIYKGGEYRF